ncbi:MAG: 16S rRNA (adenine(1518)-N(6)/adenine(1519)-N(6))-dimethyltransferase RsmA [Solirubrobacteraceae bacterium]
MRRFDVRPDHDLGQNFLVDSNILGVIDRAAQLGSQDVVLEVGGGLGVLSEYLAERTAHVHVVEIDERLRGALIDATGRYSNVTVHWADALTIGLAALDPAPTKVVANLPYGVATSVLLRSIEELPSVSVWVAMVQREVGERLAAQPAGRPRRGASGTGAYGAPSVLAQLECDVAVLRAIARTVFHPVPNVDSVLLSMRRRKDTSAGGGAEGESVGSGLRWLVAGGFAHRRKTLAGSLALSGVPPRSHPSGPGRAPSRAQVRESLVALGQPPDARAERLAPEEFRALARILQL